MGVYFGQSGEIVLKRDTLQSPLQTTLDPSDVNTQTKRFNVDHSSGSLITGDEVEISTADGSTLELVDGHNYPDGKWFVNIDPVGGIRLFESFPLAIEGVTANAKTLVTPSSTKNVILQTRNELFRHVANVKDFEMTTSREQVDLTSVGDEFKSQYEAGLISGQGSMNCIWEHSYGSRNRANQYGTDSEFPFYLAQLILRTQQGADFSGIFYVYKDGTNAKNNVYYEAECCVTNVAVSVVAAEVIETRIDFVTNGVIALKTGDTPGYILQEDDDKILQENESPILLEQV
tara:strand:- start:5059 stop:5925 length:867 start_codon:yes stop_codon:yes gene_type:complete